MSRGATPPSGGGQLFNSLLDEQLFSFRQVGTNEQIACTLPEHLGGLWNVACIIIPRSAHT